MIDTLEFFKTAWLIATNKRLSREQFERKRLKRFRQFAPYVQQNSPYYGRVMREQGIHPATCTPEQFPIITKSEVIQNFDEIVTDKAVTLKAVQEFALGSHNPADRYLGRYTVIHTSGTSGQVGYFVFDPKAFGRGIAQVANSPAQGYHMRRRRLAFVGPVDGHYAGVTLTSSVRLPPFNLVYDGRFFDVNLPMARIIDGLNEFQPDMLVSYATTLSVLAEKQLAGILKVHPTMINNSAEPIPHATRELVLKAFGPVLRNMYACSEHMVLGLREAASETMRLVEDDLILETHPDHTIVTNIFNRLMPLIRYRLSDVLRVVDANDHYPYRATADAVGRIEQTAKFINRHGVEDSISQFIFVEMIIPGARRFQVRITGPTSVVVAVVPEEGLNADGRQKAVDAVSTRLKAVLATKEMDNVTYSVVFEDDIPVDPTTKKYKLIVYPKSGS